MPYPVAVPSVLRLMPSRAHGARLRPELLAAHRSLRAVRHLRAQLVQARKRLLWPAQSRPQSWLSPKLLRAGGVSMGADTKANARGGGVLVAYFSEVIALPWRSATQSLVMPSVV